MQAGATDASANAAGRQATAAEAAATAPPPLQPPSLQAHLNRGHLPTDLLTLPVVMLVHGSILARSALLPREAWYIRRLVAVQALAMGTGVLAPAAYLAARQPIVAVLRLLDMLVLPLLVDGLRIHQPASFAAAAAAAARTGDSSPAAAAAACGSHLQCLAAAVPGWLAHAQAWLQAASLLLVAVVWLHGTVVAALGVPLSPLLHVLVHGATVGALCWNAPSAVCRRYVSDHSSSAALVETLFTAMRHAVSVACLGTSAHLEAADEQATPAQKCVVVTCALEASLGLVAPTLIAWHTQLRAAHKWLAQRRAEGGPGAAAAEQELRRSSYGWLAAPALRGARAVLGGIPVTCALAGLLAFVAALVWQQTP